MSRIIVTGGSGFIGTNLVEHYHARGDQVINLDIAAPRNAAHRGLWRRVDILDRTMVVRAIAEFDPEFVFHMAARTDLLGKAIQDYAVNTEGTSNAIEALRPIRNLRLVVFASSMLVCRIGYRPRNEFDYCPNTVYGESKVAGEQLVRDVAAGGFAWIIARPTSIWGPWFGSPYRDLFTAVQRGLYVHPRGRRIWRSYGFVLNTVCQLERMAATGGGALTGSTVYLADYEPIELSQWAGMIQRSLDVRPVKEVPLWVLQLMARGGDLFKLFGYANPPMSSFRLNNLLTEMVHNTDILRVICGDMPYSTEDGVRITCDWLRRNSG